jgi:predicted Zn-dependent peptidase
MNLAFSKLSGDANLANEEGGLINRVTAADVQRVAANTLREENASTLHYKAIS